MHFYTNDAETTYMEIQESTDGKLRFEAKDKDGDITILYLDAVQANKVLVTVQDYVEKYKTVTIEVPARFADTVKRYAEGLV